MKKLVFALAIIFTISTVAVACGGEGDKKCSAKKSCCKKGTAAKACAGEAQKSCAKKSCCKKAPAATAEAPAVPATPVAPAN